MEFFVQMTAEILELDCIFIARSEEIAETWH